MNREITPERLKGLAEAMGKTAVIGAVDVDGDKCMVACMLVAPEPVHYQPHKDWNQCGELQEHMLGDDLELTVIKANDGEYIIVDTKYNVGVSRAYDLKAAWTLAGIAAYVDSRDGV